MVEDAFWDRLQTRLEEAVASGEAVGGVAVRDLVSGRQASVRGDVLFPIASTAKIHLLTALAELHHAGTASLDERVVVDRPTGGSGVLAYLDDRVELSWRDLANLMIIVSDNTATNMIIDRVGLERMSGYLDAWGLSDTKVQRKMQDHDAVAAGLENLASPDDLVQMLGLLHAGEAFAPGVAAWALEVMKKPKKSPFTSALPPGVVHANKPGGMDRVRCDAGIVYLAHRPYAMAVLSTFGPVDPEAQARWVVDVGRQVHEAMAVLDATSRHGQGVPPGYR